MREQPYCVARATTNSIPVPSGIKHLGEIMSELLANTLFDKGRVGCGGTSIALSNDKDYIIAVPYVHLIDNKVAQFDGKVLGVTGNTREKVIRAYLESESVKKIMVTYDSLPKLLTYLQPKEYCLLVDEYHTLFTQYLFRNIAVRGVLKSYFLFKEYCFMTATMHDEEFTIEELRHIPVVSAEWETKDLVTVHAVKCTRDIFSLVVLLINSFLEGEEEGNAYIFVNSVVFIEELVDACNLTNENTRAIWSEYNEGEVGIERGKSTDIPKKINLITSSSFEGADFYDEDGRIFVASDSKKPHTLIDVSTTLHQIAGRIRDTKHGRDIYLLFTNSNYTTQTTYEEYRADVDRGIVESQNMVAELNKLSSYTQDRIQVQANGRYVSRTEDNQFFFDANLVKLEMYEFKIRRFMYGSEESVKEELLDNGFIVKNYTYHNLVEDIQTKGKDTGFRKVVDALESLDESGNEYTLLDIFSNATPLHKAAFRKYDFLQEAISVLGFDGIKKMKYNITNIKKKLISISDLNHVDKILQYLRTYRELAPGNFVTLDRAGSILGEVYTILGLKKASKAPDLRKYFEVIPKRTTIAGKSVRGLVINRPLAFVKS